MSHPNPATTGTSCHAGTQDPDAGSDRRALRMAHERDGTSAALHPDPGRSRGGRHPPRRPVASVLPSGCVWLASPWSPGSRSGEVIPEEVLAFVGERIGAAGVRARETYAARPETRREHPGVPRARRSASPSSGSNTEGHSWTGCCRSRLATTSGFALIRTLMDEPQWRRIAVVGPSTVERLVAKARLEGRHAAGQLTDRLVAGQTNALDALLDRHALCPASQRSELGAPAAGGYEPPLDDAPRGSAPVPAGCGPRPGPSADSVHALSPAARSPGREAA